MDPVQIVDVIITPQKQIFVVTDRSPLRVYEQHGNRLIARDSGFYDCMTIEPGTAKAFAGRKFTLSLQGGEQLECNGQVWSSHHPDLIGEPTVQVGRATLEDLKQCYVFFGGCISKAVLDEWLSKNKPSRHYKKYDPRYTLAYWDDLYQRHDWDKKVSPARARKLRKRGVTIRTNAVTGKKGWSPSYERQKAEIMAMHADDN